jgi:molecular chaperone GrpE
LATTSSAPDAETLHRGVQLTHQQILDLLARHQIEPDHPLGQTFDPHRHEAVDARSIPEQPDQVIVEVVQSGFRRGDELIRPARVIVNTTERAAPTNEAEDHGS